MISDTPPPTDYVKPFSIAVFSDKVTAIAQKIFQQIRNQPFSQRILGVCKVIKEHTSLSFFVQKILLPAAFLKKDEIHIARQDGKAALLKQQGSEEVKIQTKSDAELDGIYLTSKQRPSTDPPRTIILFQRNGSFFEARGIEMQELDDASFIHQLQALGWDVMLFNYRSVGDSTGKATSSQDLTEDGEAVVEFVKKKTADERNIILWGQSLGGAVAATVAKNHPDMPCVLDRTFTNLKDMIGAKTRIAPSLLAKIARYVGWHFDTQEVINQDASKDRFRTITHPHDKMIPLKIQAKAPNTFTMALDSFPTKKEMNDSIRQKHSSADEETIENIARRHFRTAHTRTFLPSEIKALFSLKPQ